MGSILSWFHLGDALVALTGGVLASVYFRWYGTRLKHEALMRALDEQVKYAESRDRLLKDLRDREAATEARLEAATRQIQRQTNEYYECLSEVFAEQTYTRQLIAALKERGAPVPPRENP